MTRRGRGGPSGRRGRVQRFADSQYDSTVQGNTLYGPTVGGHHVPTSFSAGRPVRGSESVALLATNFNPWLFEIDPVLATRQMFLGTLNKLVLAGAAVGDICFCDNFYTPDQEPGSFDWLVGMVDELCGLVDRFGTPLISGKDSSAGSVATPEGVISVPPAVYLSALAKVPSAAALRRNEWRRDGSLLVRIGPDTDGPAGTVAARALGIPAKGALDSVSVEDFGAYLDGLAEAGPTLLSGRPIGPGGSLACIAFGVLSSGLGVELVSADGDSPAELLREHRCGAIVEIDESELDSIPAALQARPLGRLRADADGILCGGDDLLAPDARRAWARDGRHRCDERPGEPSLHARHQLPARDRLCF